MRQGAALRCRRGCVVFAFVCVFMLAFFPFQAHAARFSGEYLIKVCAVNRYGEELIKGGKIACQAYISGVIDYQNMVRSMGASTGTEFCIPETESLNEIQLRVLKYFLEYKKLHRKFVAAPGVALALSSAYPCNKK